VNVSPHVEHHPTKKPRGQELTLAQQMANQALTHRRLRLDDEVRDGARLPPGSSGGLTPELSPPHSVCSFLFPQAYDLSLMGGVLNVEIHRV